MIVFKSKLATPIVVFKEDWILTADGQSTHVKRSIDIVYKKGPLTHLVCEVFYHPTIVLFLPEAPSKYR